MSYQVFLTESVNLNSTCLISAEIIHRQLVRKTDLFIFQYFYIIKIDHHYHYQMLEN